MSPTIQFILCALGFIVTVVLLWIVFERKGLEKIYVKVVCFGFLIIVFLFLLCAPILTRHSAIIPGIIPLIAFVIIYRLAGRWQRKFAKEFNRELSLCIDNARISNKNGKYYIEGLYLGQPIKLCWQGRQQGDMRGYTWAISPPVVELQIQIRPPTLISPGDNDSKILSEQNAELERLKDEVNTRFSIQAARIVDSTIEIDLIWYQNPDLKDKSLILNARADVLTRSIADNLAKYPRLNPVELSKDVNTVLTKLSTYSPKFFRVTLNSD